MSRGNYCPYCDEGKAHNCPDGVAGDTRCYKNIEAGKTTSKTTSSSSSNRCGVCNSKAHHGKWFLKNDKKVWVCDLCVNKWKEAERKKKEAEENKKKEEALAATKKAERERLAREAEARKKAEQKPKPNPGREPKPNPSHEPKSNPSSDQKNNSSDNPNTLSGHRCQSCNKELTNLDYKLNPNYCETCENNKKRKNETSFQETNKKQKTENNSVKKCNQCRKELNDFELKLAKVENGSITCDYCFVNKVEKTADEKFRRINKEIDEEMKLTDEGKEFFRLGHLLADTKDLAALESNYKTVKSNPIYTTSKKSFPGTQYGYNNKEYLDNAYYIMKKRLSEKAGSKDNQISFDTDKIKQYFRENNIYSISLEGLGNDEKLLIRYKSGQTKTVAADSQQLREIKSYLQTRLSNQVSEKELVGSDLKPHGTPKSNNLFWIIGGIGLVSLIGIIIWWVVRRNKENG